MPEGSFVAGLERVVFAGVDVLRRERVSVDGALLRPSDPFQESHSRDDLALVEEVVFVGEIAQPVELPPRDLVFAAVELEHVGEEPAGVLLFRALGLVVGDALQERVHRVLDVLAALLLLFAFVAVLARRPGNVGPQGFEPVAQAQGRDAVFLVVEATRRLTSGVRTVRSPVWRENSTARRAAPASRRSASRVKP